MFSKTEEMCIISFDSDDDIRHIDLGNYWMYNGEKVLILSEEIANKYAHLIYVPIYIKHNKTILVNQNV